ncbi:MAG TPA: S8 family serine peptidase [Vicinamibacteria bacterium]|nr:S8 family serine peptidase [Vicinamibacteria bacterium]
MMEFRKKPFPFPAGRIALLLVALVPAPGSPQATLDESPPPPATLRRSSPSLDSRLAQLAEIDRREGREAASRFAAANAIAIDARQRVRVLIHPGTAFSTGAEAAIVARVRAFAGDVQGRVGDLVEALVAIEAVEWLSGPREIGWIEPGPLPVTMQVTSQGVAVTQASAILEDGASYRPSAEPIRVGVLDGGFEGYSNLLGGELPASVTARSFHPLGIGGGGVKHGTACAEIVHDMAPEAELYLANFDTLSQHGEAVDWLVSQGVDVISYSLGWYNAGPGDGRGMVNDHVRRATTAGIEWVGSAGNDAETHWEADFSDTSGDGWHNYTSTDEGNTVSLRKGDVFIAFLNWDDWFQSSQDYDLYIFDSSNGRLMAFSENYQDGSQPPTEAAGFVAPFSGNYFVAIRRFSATRNVKLETFFVTSSPNRVQYVVPEGSLAIPADTDGAIAVGATYWRDDALESFSSQGPTTDGRTKPDLSAPDGVDTATYLALGGPFFGTSASAPHVAGAIALLKARFGIYSMDQVIEVLYGRALDRGAAGKDNLYGEGRLDLVGR